MWRGIMSPCAFACALYIAIFICLLGKFLLVIGYLLINGRKYIEIERVFQMEINQSSIFTCLLLKTRPERDDYLVGEGKSSVFPDELWWFPVRLQLLVQWCSAAVLLCWEKRCKQTCTRQPRFATNPVYASMRLPFHAQRTHESVKCERGETDHKVRSKTLCVFSETILQIRIDYWLIRRIADQLCELWIV